MQKLRLPLTFVICLLAASASAQKTTLRIQGDTLIGLLGRSILLNPQGFPQQLQTFFTSDLKDTTSQPNNLLAENIHFHFTSQSDGKDIRFKNGELTFSERSARRVSWEETSAADGLSMSVKGSLRRDGLLEYAVRVTALQDLDLKDIVMHIPFQKDVARQMVGLGKQGTYQPDSLYHWKWEPTGKKESGAWIGTVNAGLRYSLLDPATWSNDGKGGIDIGIKGKSMLANNYSGRRHMQKGDILYYKFSLLITPQNTK